MGVVYEARHLKLNRVSLEMILAGGHAGPEALALPGGDGGLVTA